MRMSRRLVSQVRIRRQKTERRNNLRFYSSSRDSFISNTFSILSCEVASLIVATSCSDSILDNISRWATRSPSQVLEAFSRGTDEPSISNSWTEPKDRESGPIEYTMRNQSMKSLIDRNDVASERQSGSNLARGFQIERSSLVCINMAHV